MTDSTPLRVEQVECQPSPGFARFVALIQTLPNRDKRLKDMVTPELAEQANIMQRLGGLGAALTLIHHVGPDAARGRAVAHKDDTPSKSGKPKHRKAAVAWDVGLAAVRAHQGKGETLKEALRLADLDLGLVGNSSKQLIKATDGGAPDHSKALDNWYRRALKTEAR